MLTIREAKRACLVNEPAVEPNQRWVSRIGDGEIGRQLRILALHPDSTINDKIWIVVDEPSRLYPRGTRDMTTCPEVNLRIVFELATMG
jgi:hypothetical protein